MRDRRNFLKSIGLGAAAVGPLAAAALAAPGKEEEITEAIEAAVAAPPTEGDMETLLEAVQAGIVDGESATQALGFGPDEVDRAKGRFYDMGTERPKFISPPADTPYRWSQRHRRPFFDMEDLLTFRVNGQSMQLKVRDQGVNYLADIMFASREPVRDWRICFIDNAGFCAMCNDDRYHDINQAGNGWDEFVNYTAPCPHVGLNYDNIRPPLDFDGSPTVVDVTATGTIKGFAIVGGTPYSTYKGDHSSDGILWAMGLFPADIHVVPGDQIVIQS